MIIETLPEDDGKRRAMRFVSIVGPMFARYKYCEWSTRHRSRAERADAFKKLHNEYSPTLKNLAHELQGFYTKIAQLAALRDDFVPIEYLYVRPSSSQDGS